jgi:hypothetical protein
MLIASLRLFDPLLGMGRVVGRDWWGSGLAFLLNECRGKVVQVDFVS